MHSRPLCVVRVSACHGGGDRGASDLFANAFPQSFLVVSLALPIDGGARCAGNPDNSWATAPRPSMRNRIVYPKGEAGSRIGVLFAVAADQCGVVLAGGDGMGAGPTMGAAARAHNGDDGEAEEGRVEGGLQGAAGEVQALGDLPDGRHPPRPHLRAHDGDGGEEGGGIYTH